jgi:hypothetical protein
MGCAAILEESEYMVFTDKLLGILRSQGRIEFVIDRNDFNGR